MSRISVIAEGTIVRGSVEGEGSLEVLGRVEGDVSMSGDITIGEAGQVLGNVSGGKLSVHGAVQGDLHGRDAVLLEPGARVVGDLSAPRIGVAGGALVRGHVRTDGDAVAAPRRVAAPAALRSAAFVAKPVAKVEPKPQPVPTVLPPPPPAPHHRAEDDADDDDDDAEDDDDAQGALAIAAARPADRRPPPPVLPSLGKGAKAKKKKGRD